MKPPESELTIGTRSRDPVHGIYSRRPHSPKHFATLKNSAATAMAILEPTLGGQELPPPDGPLLSILIPVFNEQGTLNEVIRRVEQLACSKEIVIVDDGSTDGSAELVRKLGNRSGIQAMFHSLNLGKGAAVRTALQHAKGQVVLIQDADLEYDPADVERLIQQILDDRADVVYGNQFDASARLRGEAGVEATSGFRRPRLHRTANRLLTWLSNRLTGLDLVDMETCYKAMRREVAAKLVLREDRFGFEPEITAKIARQGWRVVEIPVRYEARSRSSGKKIRMRDGLRAMWCIARYSRWD